MIEVKNVAIYVGPSVYASAPVMVKSLRVTPDEFPKAPHRISLIQAASARWFVSPALPPPVDAAGVGSFIVAWARAAQAEFGAAFQVATVCVENGETRLVLEYENPKVAHEAIILAAKLVVKIEKLTSTEVKGLMREFWASCRRNSPDFQAQFLINHARKRGIPCLRSSLDPWSWQYGWGAKSERFFETSPAEDSAEGHAWSREKRLCKEIFASLGAPVARSIEVKDEAGLAEASRQIGFPCVTKPVNRGRSIGVTTNIRDQAGLIEGYRAAARRTEETVMVEKHMEGEVHRLMVIRGKLWRAIRRERPSVEGDGQSTVLALAEALRAEGRKRLRPGSFWKPASLDEGFHAALREQGIGENDVLPKGARVRLRNIPLITEGAVYFDVTEAIHPDTRAMSEALAENFGIKVCGLDFITTDIARSCFGHGVFLEINVTPGVRIPQVAGIDPDEIARVILGDKPGILPLVLIIAPRSAHESIRAGIPHDSGLGWICGDRAGVGGMELPSRQPSYHAHLDQIVRHKTVEAIVLVCTMEAIVERGMPLKRARLAVLLEPCADHPAWVQVVKAHSKRTIENAAINALPEWIASVRDGRSNSQAS